MAETFWGNLPEGWLTFWEKLPEAWFLPFAIVLFYWLGRRLTKQAPGRSFIGYAERLEELEEKDRDIEEWMRRQNEQYVAALSGQAKVTNGLLGAILAALLFG